MLVRTPSPGKSSHWQLCCSSTPLLCVSVSYVPSSVGVGRETLICGQWEKVLFRLKKDSFWHCVFGVTILAVQKKQKFAKLKSHLGVLDSNFLPSHSLRSNGTGVSSRMVWFGLLIYIININKYLSCWSSLGRFWASFLSLLILSLFGWGGRGYDVIWHLSLIFRFFIFDGFPYHLWNPWTILYKSPIFHKFIEQES